MERQLDAMAFLHLMALWGFLVWSLWASFCNWVDLRRLERRYTSYLRNAVETPTTREQPAYDELTDARE